MGQIRAIRCPRMDAIRARRNEIHDDLFDEQFSLPHFGDIVRMKEWLMLTYIKENIEEIREKQKNGEEQSAQEFVEMFKWQDEETKEWKYPSLRSAQICIEDAGRPDLTKLWKKWHDAFLWTSCGNTVAEDPTSDKPKTAESKHRATN